MTSSLRTALTAAIFALAGLGLLVSGALVVLTTYLQWETAVIRESVDSVRLAQEAEILLLLHERAVDPLVRREIEGRLRQTLSKARGHVTTEHEAAVLREAESQVERYLAGSRSPEPALDLEREAAYSALDALVDENITQARAGMRDAVRWDRIANVLGLTTAVLPLALAIWILAWLKARAFRPLFVLAGAMERFGQGERDVRAEEAGPLEVCEMAARFNAMASALAAQRDIQMAFLAGVAHDLRNPLSVLATSLAMVRPDRPLPPEPRLRRIVEVLGRQLGRMDRMVGDFLDMAKIEAGKLELLLGACDARTLVREVAEMFEGTSPRHQVRITLPGEEIPIRCDPLRMEQVLTNLVSNAIKYSPDGGVVAVTLAREEDEAVIVVEDQGIGMSEDEQRILFEPFSRQGAAKEVVPGLGLGLFVVKRIILAHGGKIEVESAKGRGSTFRVRLAIAPGAPATP
jgi:signal transduction histidine kinase